MTDYSKLPAGADLNFIERFQAHVSDEKLEHFKKLLEFSPIAPVVFENSNAGRRYGIKRDWIENAKKIWLNDFNWRNCEERINSFPNFKASVRDAAGNAVDIQFLALFSERADAVPIAFFHGWPGSICEFLDVLEILRKKYTPRDLPYHVVVPSLPGYAYSSGPPVDTDYAVDIAAGALHNLMLSLGFGKSGYLAQGGDLGSFISRILAMQYDECKGMHVNMMGMPPGGPGESPTAEEQRALQRAYEFQNTGNAFLLEDGTRTATIGIILSSSPLALLAWIGEKFLEWSDEDPPLQKILEAVTLYWMTDTISRSLYHHRGMGDPNDKPAIAMASVGTSLAPLKLPYVGKPAGYSAFANEIVPSPKSWAVKSCNLISFNQHESGGHFAAMERPADLLSDVEQYASKVWPMVGTS